ncbi:hypothetical protein NDI52_12940 [Leptolyngbya sp. PL-A3]|nr:MULTISPECIES: hypothetical protein [unclassified Leptolyngbya]
MGIALKPLHEQVIVITGASNVMGLVTACMAARQGVEVALAAREDVCRCFHLQALHGSFYS